MTPKETLALLAYFADRYPAQARMSKGAVVAYVQELAEYPPESAQRAAQRIVRASEFFPSVATIVREIVRLEVNLPDAESAWAQILECGDDFDELDGVVMRAFKSAGGSWALRNEPTHFVRKAFLDAYAAEKSAIEDYARDVTIPGLERDRLSRLPAADMEFSLQAAPASAAKAPGSGIVGATGIPAELRRRGPPRGKG